MFSRSAFYGPRQLLPISSRFLGQLQRRSLITDAALKPAIKPAAGAAVEEPSPLSKLPTGVLLRSVALTTVMATSWLLRPSMAFLALITQSNSALLNPDRNPILNRILQWTIYDHFCAGNSIQDVSKTVKYIKKLGYHGIILGYSKEVVLDPNVELPQTGVEEYPPECYGVIDQWKKGNIETLEMIESGDLLAINDRCWSYRHGWAIALMRKHNRDGNALIYNTIQAYLKGARANAERHLTLAAQEGWTAGVKVVRGAYIENEVRSLIHDTKQDTDRSYDDIADMFISRRLPKGSQPMLRFPSAALVLATHNAESAEKALRTHRQRVSAGLPTVPMKCAQIMGMADELSCKLLQDYERNVSQDTVTAETPRIFKCLPWGSVQECLGYLYRRAVENRGAVERTQHMARAMRQELWRRMFG
ncbi:hypothetical protein ACJ41O_012141 [Fusarium nematophilum]